MKKLKVSRVRRLFGYLAILLAFLSGVGFWVDASQGQWTHLPPEQVGSAIFWMLIAVWSFGGFRFLTLHSDAQVSLTAQSAKSRKRTTRQSMQEDEPWRY